MPERTRSVILTTEGADKHHPVDSVRGERLTRLVPSTAAAEETFLGVGGFQQPVPAQGHRPSVDRSPQAAVSEWDGAAGEAGFSLLSG